MFKVRAILVNTCLAVFDLAAVAACYGALLYWEVCARGIEAAGSFLWHSERILALGWTLGIWLALLWHFGMYQSRRMATVYADFGIILKTSLTGLVILGALAHFVPALQPTPHFLVWFAALTMFVLTIARLGVRFALRELRRRGHDLKNLLLVTSPENGARLREKIGERAHYGYRIVRHLEYSTDDPAQTVQLLAEFPGALDQDRVEDVILALPAEARVLTARLVNVCEARGVNVRLVPDLFPLIQSENQVDLLDGIPLINVHLYPTEQLGYLVLKRAFDIMVSLAVLILISPLLLLVAVLVKATSRGPVLFAQERVGLNGRKFRMLKFRTMRIDAENNSAPGWTRPNDVRVTSLGRWLRRSNLDELPQFWNVLKGDMSIVGPRPERPHFIARFREEVPNYMLRHYVKCGITGWAQVNGWRGDTSIRERVAHDLYYLQHWGWALDMKILFWTVTRAFFHPNAY
jgi:Undecaprenyl-phosphate glucose phosphotransferase